MVKAITYKRNNTALEKIVLSKVFWLCFISFGFAYPIVKSIYRVLPPPLPKMIKLPEYSLTNSFKKPFGSKDLLGRTYIASFMFTSCPTSCPALMDKMDKVQKRVKGVGTKIALITFTVDPETDTPELLYKFARKRHANPYIWSFLTGDVQAVEAIVLKGFKVPMGDKEEMKGIIDGEQVTLMDIAHSNRFVLVDREGFVRGYYSSDKNGINKLMIDVGLLVNEPEKVESINY